MGFFFPCSCFLLEAVTKKKKKSANTVLSTLFLTTQCTCIDLWGRNGISQDISRIDFKDCSRETWNCCKPFPWRIAMKIVLSSLLSSVLKCHFFKCCMLISSEPCNHINLYTRTYPVVFDNISSNNNWELERKNHQLSGSLIDLVMQKKKNNPGWQTPHYFEKFKPVHRMGKIWL